METISHLVEYFLTQTAQSFFSHLSTKTGDKVGSRIGELAYSILSSRKTVSNDNLSRAFGDSLSSSEIEEITKEVFRNMGRTFAEVSRFSKTSLEDISRIVSGNAKEVLDKVSAEGRGALIATAHFGNWEILGAWVASTGYPTDLIVLPQHNQLVSQQLNAKRKSMGVGIIEVRKNIRQVYRALRDNHMVVIAADQHDPTAQLIIDFFGRKTAAAKGQAIFSIRNNAPVIPMVINRKSYDDFQIISGDPIYPNLENIEEQEIKRIVEEYHKFLENVITEHKSQWLWTHRRWKL